MEAIFFISSPQDAMRVRSEDDLDDGPAAEPIRLASPAGLRALAAAVGVDRRAGVGPLTDATCQSFPIWVYRSQFSRRLGELEDDDVDRVAEAWLADDAMADGECDLYEASEVVEGLRRSVLESEGGEGRICVLIEEKAI